MTEKYYKTLELDKILMQLQELAVCEETKQAAFSLRPYKQKAKVKEALQETSAMVSLIESFSLPRYSNVNGVSLIVTRAMKGSNLSMAELLLVASALRNFRYLRNWYEKNVNVENSADKLLEYKFQQLSTNESLENAIFDAIISENEMADNASTELYDIRKKIRNTEASIREKLESMIRSVNYQKYLQDSVITLRNGKFVVPVKAEHRSEIGGVIHDVSSSGSTMFIEPSVVVEANAKIMQLKNSEEEEINRILHIFTEQIAVDGAVFLISYEAMLEIDFVLTKAKLALSMSAFCPSIEDCYSFSLKQARHPLLAKDTAIPIDISLGYEYDTLIITGPNTGGKTVALKTAGLLCVMACCGLLIPASENSSICVFEEVLVDIGDEQSIEQSLSTFSGHMKNITQILKHANEKSLVLLDELGAGTDPAEGAALALSIIEKLRSQGSKTLATTHYAELKIFALDTKGVQNASCEFDIQTLRPTYRLIVGVPGRSNAFLIGEKLGIPEDIIKHAKVHLSVEDRKFEEILVQLDELKRELKTKEDEVSALQNAASTVLEKAEAERNAFIKQGEIELVAARAKAKQITESVQKEAYALLDEMKALQKQENLSAQQKAQRARQIARNDTESILGNITSGEVNGDMEYPPLKTVKAGDKVVMNGLGTVATVISPVDANGYVEILAGIVKTKVLLKDLHMPTVFEKPKKTKRQPQTNTANNTSKAQRSVSIEINVIGKNVEEALMDVDAFIDNAVLGNIPTIYIIHGKGTGALRKGIHAHLQKHRNVHVFRLGKYGEGEDGVTIVELK